MAATKISDYAKGGDNWTELLTTIEKQRKGYLGISLTNYDNNSLPAIAAGSYFEISGALYGFESEEAITGSPSSGNTNYIYINGTTFIPVWTTTAPTWSDAKNGWYDAGETHRYVGGCYYDGSNYSGKWVYQKGSNRITSNCKFGGRVERKYSVSFPAAFWDDNLETIIKTEYINFQSSSDTDVYVAVNLPDGAVITNLYSYARFVATGNINIRLERSPVDTIDDELLVSNAHSTTGYLNNSSISNPTVNNEDYTYAVRISHYNHNGHAYVYGIVLTYTIEEPKP